MTNDTTCEVEGCDRVIKAKRLCNMHLKRLYRLGEIGEAEARRSKDRAAACVVTGCIDPVSLAGMCGHHYYVKNSDRPYRLGRAVPTAGVCMVSDCEKAIYARRLCGSHYDRCRKFSLSPIQLMQILADRTCDICADAIELSRAHIDHDHACCPGERSCGSCIRGVLCVRCNILLGMARDEVRILVNCANYLSRSA